MIATLHLPRCHLPPRRFLLGWLAAMAMTGCFGGDEESVEPALEHIFLSGVADGSVQPYATVHVMVTGRGIIGASVVVEAHATFESTGETSLLQTWHETVVYSNYYQHADVDFVVAGAILDRADRISITFRAIYDDQVLASDPISLVVDPVLQAVRVFYEGPSGRAELGEGSPFPITQELTVRIESMGLVDRTLIAELVHRQGDEETIVDTLEERVASQELELMYALDAEQLEGEEGAPIRFNVRVDDLALASPWVVGSETGIHSCGWYDRAVSPIGAEAEVANWTPLILRAYAWGVEGAEATFEVWDEDEASSNDFVESLIGTVAGGVAEVEWTVYGTGDGPFDNTNEYFLRVRIGALMCRSTRIIVG